MSGLKTQTLLLKSNGLFTKRSALFLEDGTHLLNVRTSGYEEIGRRIRLEDVAYMTLSRKQDMATCLVWALAGLAMFMSTFLFSIYWQEKTAADECIHWLPLPFALLLLGRGFYEGFVRKRLKIQIFDSSDLRLSVVVNISKKKERRVFDRLAALIQARQVASGSAGGQSDG